MNVWDAIFERRSIGKVKPDPVDPKLIDRILEAAVWAPVHFQTEPWRFFVLTGEGRRPLGRTLAAIAQEKMDDPSSEANRAKLEREEAKPFRAPVVIAVAAVPQLDDPRVIQVEEIAATSAAIQNMLLAAHALGLGAIWRTSPAAYHPKMKEAFGLKEQDEMLGFIYIGYPDIEPPAKKRTSHQEKTKWIDTDRNYTE